VKITQPATRFTQLVSTAATAANTTGVGSIPVPPLTGTDGYVLTYVAANGDLELKPAASPSPLTTKGDIHGFSTVDARVPIGTNGQILEADSTQTLGLKWVTSGGVSQLASITAASAAIANTETVVVSASLAANTITAGMSFRIVAAGVGTTGLVPGNDTFRIRIGTTTLTGTIPATVAPAATASVTAQPFSFEAIITCRTTGASGAIIGAATALSDNVTTGLFALLVDVNTTTATVALDTTAVNLLEFTFQSGAASSSVTFHVATIEQLGSGGGGASSVLSPTALQSVSSLTGHTTTLGSAPASGARVFLLVNANGASTTAVSSTNTTWTKLYETGSTGFTSLWVGVVAGTGGTSITVTSTATNVFTVAIVTNDAVTPTLAASTNYTGITNGFKLVGPYTPAAAGRLLAFCWGGDNFSLTGYMAPGLPGPALSTTAVSLALAYSPAGSIGAAIASANSSNHGTICEIT
jgi:hypothetical protein